jgi:polyphenol oxidase
VSFPGTLAREVVDEFTPLGVLAFTTGRQAGSFGTSTDEAVGTVMRRWGALRAGLRPHATRLATSIQVHGPRVAVHQPGWEGWLRVDEVDGHMAPTPGTAMAISVADCVPVFIAHPSGATAVLHAGWRGTASRILEEALRIMGVARLAPPDLRLHLGPAICGRCYEVTPDVYARITGREVPRPTTVDLREVLAGQARASGIRNISTSQLCTRCDNTDLFSHRAGDAGRQLGVIVAPVP